MLPFLVCSSSHHHVKSHSIQSEQFSSFSALDGSSSWGIIQKGQFSKNISALIGLQESFSPINHFVTIVEPRLNNVEQITSFSFFDNFAPF